MTEREREQLEPEIILVKVRRPGIREVNSEEVIKIGGLVWIILNLFS